MGRGPVSGDGQVFSRCKPALTKCPPRKRGAEDGKISRKGLVFFQGEAYTREKGIEKERSSC